MEIELVCVFVLVFTRLDRMLAVGRDDSILAVDYVFTERKTQLAGAWRNSAAECIALVLTDLM